MAAAGRVRHQAAIFFEIQALVKVKSISQPSRKAKREATSFSRQEIAKLQDPEEALNYAFFVFPFGAITSGADGKI